MTNSADKNTGWIKLHRSLAESNLWKSEKFTKAQAWVDLIIGANHKKGSFWVRGIEVKLERGQIGWSEITMAKRWGWSRSKVRRFLGWLKSDQKITQQAIHKITTIVTLVNYELYQRHDTTDGTIKEQQKDNRRYTNKNDKKNTNTIASERAKKKKETETLPKSESLPIPDEDNLLIRKRIEEAQRKYYSSPESLLNLREHEISRIARTHSFSQEEIRLIAEQAHSWVVNNPGKSKKIKDFYRFFLNWLRKEITGKQAVKTGGSELVPASDEEAEQRARRMSDEELKGIVKRLGQVQIHEAFAIEAVKRGLIGGKHA